MHEGILNGKIVVSNTDLFSQSTDIVVLPCSRSGTISDSIAAQIEKHDIPRTRWRKELGEIEIIQLSPDNSYAKYVCWAASVAATYSTLAALRTIGRDVAQVAESRRNIRIVSSPLLGTGFGGVDKLKSALALAEGFVSAGTKGVVLRLHVLDESCSDEIQRFLDCAQANFVTVPETVELGGHQLQDCNNALLSAFDNFELKQLVKYELDENLDALTGGTTLKEKIFELTLWAERHGKLAELIRGAVKLNPTNPELSAFVRGLSD